MIVDSSLIITIASSATAVGGGFFALWRHISSNFADQSRAIGRLEGKVDGMNNRVHGYEKQIEGFDKRIGRLDQRINGLAEKQPVKDK